MGLICWHLLFLGTWPFTYWASQLVSPGQNPNTVLTMPRALWVHSCSMHGLSPDLPTWTQWPCWPLTRAPLAYFTDKKLPYFFPPTPNPWWLPWPYLGLCRSIYLLPVRNQGNRSTACQQRSVCSSGCKPPTVCRCRCLECYQMQYNEAAQQYIYISATE